MKPLLISFLFFICYNYSFSYNNITLTIQKTDSLAYYYNLANNPKTSNSLIKAYIFYNKEKDKSIAENNTFLVVKYLRQIAIIQFELGDYYGSENSIVEALNILPNINDDNFALNSKVGLYNQLGRVYMELLNYDSSLKYYDKALKIANNEHAINVIKNNKALIFIEQEKYKLAEKELIELYRDNKKSKDLKQIALVLANLGHVESKLFRPYAIDHLIEALNIRIKINDKKGIHSSYDRLSEYYSDRKDKIKALLYANKAYDIAKTLKSPAYIENALANLMSISEDPKILEYQKIKDSLNSAKQIAENKFALVKYNYFEQERIANKLRIEKAQEQNTKIIYQIIGLFVGIIAIIFILVLRSRYRMEKIRQLNKTESRISKKIHDELANDVFLVMSHLQNHDTTNEVLDKLESIYTKTRDISKSISDIDVKNNFVEQLKDLFLSYNDNKISIISRNTYKIDWGTISDLKKVALYRVIQELLTNMKKHSKATNALISFHSSGNKTIVNYKDNGKGCSLKKKGGLLNAETRIKALKGNIIFESKSGKGFNAKIII